MEPVAKRAVSHDTIAADTPVVSGRRHLSTRQFLFFADFEAVLSADMRKNREAEVRNFGGLPRGLAPGDIPDPAEPATFEHSKLDWREADETHAIEWQALLKRLLRTRQKHIVPLLGSSNCGGRVVDSPVHGIFMIGMFKEAP